MKTAIKLTITAALVASALSSFADITGNITIQGTVANNTAITVTSQEGYNSLNIASGETDKLVAVVNEKSNNKNGYTVTLASANATGAQAFLKTSGGSSDTVNYSMKYGGSAVTLSSGSATVTDVSSKTATGAGVDKNLTVTLSAAWVDTDTYLDTLTLTITVK